MSDFKSTFQNCSSEYLLQRRALGDELSDAAHRAIEEIFAERGEVLPPRPTKPIESRELSGPRHKPEWGGKLVGFFLFLIAMVAIEVLAKSWFGLLLMPFLFASYALDWARRLRLSKAELARERELELERRDGITELMKCAANGDLLRLKELLSYGSFVDATSNSGATALMYAALNNQADAVDLLIASGAKLEIKSDKGLTAAQIAKRAGFTAIADRLELACSAQRCPELVR